MRTDGFLVIALIVSVLTACGPSSNEIAAEQRAARYKAESEAMSARLQAQSAAQSASLAQIRTHALEAELLASKKREEDARRIAAQTPKRDPLADLRKRLAEPPLMPQPSPEAKSIDAEVAKILGGEHGKLPPAQQIRGDAAGIAAIQIENLTEHTLTVLYSGKTSQKAVINAKGTASVSVAAGPYSVAASVDAPGVIPFAGSDNLSGGSYSNEFYIKTTFR